MDKFFRIAIITGVLLAGIGLFYHYLIYLPEIERERYTALEKKKAESRQEEESRRPSYIACLGKVRESYEGSWAQSCQNELKKCLDRGVKGEAGIAVCRNLWGSSECQGDRHSWTTDDWNRCGSKKLDASPRCLLLTEDSDPINAAYEQNKKRCATEAQPRLQ